MARSGPGFWGHVLELAIGQRGQSGEDFAQIALGIETATAAGFDDRAALPGLGPNETQPIRPPARASISLQEPNPPPRIARVPGVLRLRPAGLGNFPLNHLLRDPPPRRVRIDAARMNRVEANIQDVPAAKPA